MADSASVGRDTSRILPGGICLLPGNQLEAKRDCGSLPEPKITHGTAGETDSRPGHKQEMLLHIATTPALLSPRHKPSLHRGER